MQLKLYKIYYDEISLKSIRNPFIPLYNNDDSGWFEMIPIFEYFKINSLNENEWYGFLSPKFEIKTGFSAENLLALIQKADNEDSEVVIISPAWDQICYFQNPIEQAEYWHNDIGSIFKNYLSFSDIKIEPNNWVSCLENTVYSNYIIAKKSFWVEWCTLIEKLIIFEKKYRNLDTIVEYGSKFHHRKVKAFIQERVVNIVLSLVPYKITKPEYEFEYSIDTNLFKDSLENRKLLITCNQLKKKYLETKNSELLLIYKKIRNDIKFSR
jgi:hypothetical protein